MDSKLGIGHNVPMAKQRKRKQEKDLSKYDLEFMARTWAARTAKKDLTQDKIAKRLGYNQDHYKQFEVRGKMPHELIPGFLEITGVSYGYLFTGNEKGPAWHDRYHELLTKQEEDHKKSSRTA